MENNNRIINEKTVFFVGDFDKLKWHDCKIYGFMFDDINYKFYLDIDFIVEWIDPINEHEGYKFKVAPATLVFHNAWDIIFDIETNLSLEIDDVVMSNPHEAKNKEVVLSKPEYDWHIELQQGDIFFKSIGFELYLRKPSILTENQTFGLEARGGVSFSISR
jgi:hypothetical protein